MEMDFAEVLLEVMERGASDLHLTAGSPPMVRERGALNALEFVDFLAEHFRGMGPDRWP